MQAKRDAEEAAAAAAEQNVANDDDDDDVFDGGGHGGCGGTARAPAAVRTSPSGDSFAMLAVATKNQLDKLNKRLVGGSPLELAGVRDHLSVAGVHSPTDYIALPTVRLFVAFLFSSMESSIKHRTPSDCVIHTYRCHFSFSDTGNFAVK